MDTEFVIPVWYWIVAVIGFLGAAFYLGYYEIETIDTDEPFEVMLFVVLAAALSALWIFVLPPYVIFRLGLWLRERNS